MCHDDLFFAANRLGGEGEVVLKLLLKKGIITQTEYDSVMKELQGTAKIEETVQQNKEKIEQIAQAQQERIVHVDKHLAHMEEGIGRTIGGLTVAGGVTMVVQGSSGNDDNTGISPEGDVTDGSYSADLELSAPLAENGEAFLHIEAGEGNGLEGDEITSFWGVDGNAGDSGAGLELTEASYEHRFLDDRLTAIAGKLDLTRYFDCNEVANYEKTQFLANGFVNNIAVEFPDNSVGVRLTASPTKLIDLSIGWQSGDADWEDIFDKSFYIAEIDLKPQIGGRQGNYRVYTWTNQTDHTTLKGDKDDESGWGVGTSIDQKVTDGLTLFARFGWQDKDVYDFDKALSVGFSVAGSSWGREDDEFGMAYGMALLSDDYEANLRSFNINPEDETHFEAYYRFSFNEYLAISPDLQIVNNALGHDEFDTVWLGAVRARLFF